MYNYNFKNPVIWKINNVYYIKEDKKTYILKPVKYININYLNVTNKDDSYYKTILNKDKTYITTYKKVDYILIKLSNDTKIKEEEITKVNIAEPAINNNWKELWTNKIDYINKLFNNEKEQDEYLLETKDYYLGMAETAILFLEYNKSKLNNNYTCFCRKRITERIFRLPDNIIIDSKERDISEYIKYLFFEKNESNNKILTFLNKLNYKKLNKHYIYSRLIFPTYYFDLIELAKVNNRNVKNDIQKIIKKSKDYEILLDDIQKIYFPNNINIEWLKKTRE